MTEKNNIERSIGRLEGKLDVMIMTINKLTNAFDNLEKGRLSTLEINFAKMQTELSDKSRSVAMWTGSIVSIIVSIISAIIISYFNHIFRV